MVHQYAQYNLPEMVSIEYERYLSFAFYFYLGIPLSKFVYFYLSFLGKYVLSSGKDSLVKLWEMSTTRCLIAYTGAGATGKQVKLCLNTIFSALSKK